MPKKILTFSLAYYPKYYGGAEVAIKEITDRIGPGDIEFHMLTMRFDSSLPREEKIGNVIIHRVGFGIPHAELTTTHSLFFYILKILFVPMAAWRGVTLHRKYRFDALWAMMSYMLFPISLMRLFGVRVPYVLTLQEGDPFERVFARWYIRPFSFLLRYGFRNASVVQAISTFLARWADQYGYRGQVVVVPNGVDTRSFSEGFSPAAREDLERELGKKAGDVYLITASRFVHKNAIEDVITALVHLPENIYFLVLGAGPEEAMLRKVAASAGVEDRVKWLGQVDHVRLPGYLQVSDIFVRPSRSEGMGNSFIEAMAAGLPVIATQEGGIADFLFDAKRNPDKPATGWAVDKDSPEQIAQAVKDIIGNPEQVKNVIETARKLAFEKYDWGLLARDMREKVFGKVLKNS